MEVCKDKILLDICSCLLLLLMVYNWININLLFLCVYISELKQSKKLVLIVSFSSTM